MERNEIMEKVTSVFRDVFDDEELVITDSTTAADIEDWDSLTHITLISAIEENPNFVAPERVNELKKRAEGVINVGNSMGEGWYLAAEMLEFADHGYENIVIAQPFGCLPCHVAAKGMINKVRRIDPRLNVVDIEYDPGATRVNQENRIKLMLVVAKENLK